MTELKLCPFCRETAWRGFNDTAICPGSITLTQGFSCPMSQRYVTVEQWNCRALTPEGEALREVAVVMQQHGEAFDLNDYIHAILKAYGIQLPAVEGDDG